MVKRIINSYFELLDEKLENWTLVVLIIALLIVFVSILINDVQLKKGTIIEKSKVEINWQIYQLVE